jgi:hypothetical protein
MDVHCRKPPTRVSRWKKKIQPKHNKNDRLINIRLLCTYCTSLSLCHSTFRHSLIVVCRLCLNKKYIQYVYKYSIQYITLKISCSLYFFLRENRLLYCTRSTEMRLLYILYCSKPVVIISGWDKSKNINFFAEECARTIRVAHAESGWPSIDWHLFAEFYTISNPRPGISTYSRRKRVDNVW